MSTKDELQAALDAKSDELKQLQTELQLLKNTLKTKNNVEISTSATEHNPLVLNAADIIKEIEECTDDEAVKKKALDYINFIESRSNQVDEGLKDIQELKNRMDQGEQYSMKNSLLIHGLKKIPTKLLGYKFCIWIAELLNSFPGLDFPISPAEIDCAHPMPTFSGKSVVIVKFVRRAVRDEIFYKKKFLKFREGEKISVSEHLTKANLQLMSKAKSMVGNLNAFCKNCKVYAKWGKNKFPITGVENLKKLEVFVRENPNPEPDEYKPKHDFHPRNNAKSTWGTTNQEYFQPPFNAPYQSPFNVPNSQTLPAGYRSNFPLPGTGYST